MAFITLIVNEEQEKAYKYLRENIYGQKNREELDCAIADGIVDIYRNVLIQKLRMDNELAGITNFHHNIPSYACSAPNVIPGCGFKI